MFGTNYPLNHKFASHEWGWFLPEQLGKYKDNVQFIPRFGSTLIYLRNDTICKKIYNICIDVMDKPTEYGFTNEVLDDQIFAVGLAVMGCKCIAGGKEWDCCVYPFYKEHGWKPHPQMHKKNLSYNRPDYGNVNNVKLCHWGNYLTTKALYKREIKVLNAYIAKRENIITGIVRLYDFLIPLSSLSIKFDALINRFYGSIVSNTMLRKILYPIEVVIKGKRR